MSRNRIEVKRTDMVVRVHPGTEGRVRCLPRPQGTDEAVPAEGISA